MKLYIVPHTTEPNRYEVWQRKRSGDRVIGDATECEGREGWAVLHHSTDLSYDSVDTLAESLALLTDIHEEYLNDKRRSKLFSRKKK